MTRTIVERLNTTVMKSTALAHPDRIEVRPGGVVGDRRYLVVHEDRTRLSGSQKAPLLAIRATVDGSVLRVMWPDGASIEGSAASTGETFDVRLFDRTVAVRRLDHPAAERLSSDVGRRVLIAEVLEDHAGGHHPLTLVSRATVLDVGHRGGAGVLDPRRFRATIELEGCEPYEEDEWCGRVVRIGDAVARVTSRIARCVLTTLDPDSGRPDFPTLEILAGYRRIGTELPLGVYADVEAAGTIRVGDSVEILPDPVATEPSRTRLSRS